MNTRWHKSLTIDGFPGNKNKAAHKTFVYAAGKSGGHIVPCITLATAEKKDPTTTNIFFTTTGLLDKNIIENNKAVVDIHQSISLTHMPHTWHEYGPFFWHLCSSFCTAFYVLYTTKPACIFSTGGIVSLPVCLAGYILQIPIQLYELNAVPGNAITTLATLADTIHCCFTGLDQYLPPEKVVFTDYPIRYNSDEIQKNSPGARLSLGLDPHLPTITILGGSQGSQFINSIIDQITSIDRSYWKNVQFIHQTGHNQTEAVQALFKAKNIKAYVFDYSANLSSMYAAADMVIGRAGAGTIFETAAFNKPCILIPLETQATDHQLLNAHRIATQKPELFSVLRQEDITTNPSLLIDSIQSILKKRS